MLCDKADAECERKEEKLQDLSVTFTFHRDSGLRILDTTATVRVYSYIYIYTVNIYIYIDSFLDIFFLPPSYLFVLSILTTLFLHLFSFIVL